jgi:hypothetical protein
MPVLFQSRASVETLPSDVWTVVWPKHCSKRVLAPVAEILSGARLGSRDLGRTFFVLTSQGTDAGSQT